MIKEAFIAGFTRRAGQATAALGSRLLNRAPAANKFLNSARNMTGKALQTTGNFVKKNPVGTAVGAAGVAGLAAGHTIGKQNSQGGY